MSNRYFVFFLVAAMSLLGCEQKGYTTYRVSGTVKFSDGSVPKGEVAQIMFTPMQKGPGTKAASGLIQADGAYLLSTIEPDDGAFAGEYKVVIVVYKTYTGREPLIGNQYLDTPTTPLTATVEPGKENKFDFVVEKAP